MNLEFGRLDKIAAILISIAVIYIGWIMWKDPLNKAEQDAEERSKGFEEAASTSAAIYATTMLMDDMPVTTKTERSNISDISRRIREEIIIPWERENLIHIPIEEEFAASLTAILIPPHPEELVLKARRQLEKRIAMIIPQERITVILPDAIKEWAHINAFSDQWTLVTKDDEDDYYRERFVKMEQLVLKAEGGFNIERDDELHGTIYPFPTYGPLKPLNLIGRYSELFSN
jgi:hypothetical protein